MSTNPSPPPAKADHVRPAYIQTAQLTLIPTHTLSASSTLPGSAQGPFGDMKTENGAQELAPPQSQTPSNAKNGATGPAEVKPKPHVCQTCQRGFTMRGHLQRHERVHTGVKAFNCPFPGCETRTSRLDNLQQQSQGSANGTPSSTASGGAGDLPSPHATAISQRPSPYAPLNIYNPQAHDGHLRFPIPSPDDAAPQSASTNSSRVPSPLNCHPLGLYSVTSKPSAHTQHQYFPQPFSPAYDYSGARQQQAYLYSPAGALASLYGDPHGHHALYSRQSAAEHGQRYVYSPVQTGFNGRSREGQYGTISPRHKTAAVNGDLCHARISTPLGQSHDDASGRAEAARPPPPGHRKSSPHDSTAEGFVDQTTMPSRQP